MPDPTDLDNQQEEDPGNQNDSPVIKDLRKRAKDAERLEKELATIKRDLVIQQAGLGSLSEKQLKALSAAHDGDWTSDTLKATATELGFSAPTGDQPPTPAPTPPPAMERVDQATGQPPQPPPDLDAKIAAAPDTDAVMALLKSANLLVE